MKRSQHYDVVVIGAGTAGMTAAIALARAGAQVCVLAKGIGSTNLAPGTIDVFGYDDGTAVSSPSAAIAELAHSRPAHPYALLGVEPVRRALELFAELAAAGPQPGYHYVGDLDHNFRLPTALGACKPSALVPETFAGGDTAELGRALIVGVQGLRDFHPALCAANLREAGLQAEFANVALELTRADVNTLSLARKFDDPSWRAGFAGKLAGTVRGVDAVGLPAMLGLRDPHGALSDLQDRLGRRVFEISTLPPSVPGMRMFEIFRSALRAAGGRLALGAAVIDQERNGERVLAVSTASAGSPTSYSADAFVLAAGGFTSGAINLDSHWCGRDTVLDLPLDGLLGPDHPRFVEDYFAEQPSARAGIAVTPQLRAAGAANVFVAGSGLPGAVPWREASGEGIALASGLNAAERVAAELGDRLGDVAPKATV